MVCCLLFRVESSISKVWVSVEVEISIKDLRSQSKGHGAGRDSSFFYPVIDVVNNCSSIIVIKHLFQFRIVIQILLAVKARNSLSPFPYPIGTPMVCCLLFRVESSISKVWVSLQVEISIKDLRSQSKGHGAGRDWSNFRPTNWWHGHEHQQECWRKQKAFSHWPHLGKSEFQESC